MSSKKADTISFLLAGQVLCHKVESVNKRHGRDGKRMGALWMTGLIPA